MNIISCNNSETKPETKSEQPASNSKDAITVQAIDTTKLAKGAVFYQCEMDKEIISDKPGTCPKCGMELEKVVKQ